MQLLIPPKTPIRTRITLRSEKRVDISNSLIPYTSERVLSVTANNPRTGTKAD